MCFEGETELTVFDFYFKMFNYSGFRFLRMISHYHDYRNKIYKIINKQKVQVHLLGLLQIMYQEVSNQSNTLNPNVCFVG